MPHISLGHGGGVFGGTGAGRTVKLCKRACFTLVHQVRDAHVSITVNHFISVYTCVCVRRACVYTTMAIIYVDADASTCDVRVCVYFVCVWLRRTGDPLRTYTHTHTCSLNNGNGDELTQSLRTSPTPARRRRRRLAMHPH